MSWSSQESPSTKVQLLTAVAKFIDYQTDPASLNVYANILTLFHLQLAAALQNSGHFSEERDTRTDPIP